MASDTPQSNTYRHRPQHERTIDPELGRLQPQDLEMEEAVLGALMLEKDAYAEISDILTPECFYDDRNRKVYSAIASLGNQQRPIDMLTVADQLRADGTLDEVGGAVRIGELTGRVMSAANIDFHARVVAQKAIARRLITFAGMIQAKAYDESIDVYDLMQLAEGQLFEISKTSLKREVQQIDPIINEAVQKIQDAANRESGLSGLASGYHALDKLTGGWQDSDLIIIAARPAMGKTALVLSMAKNMAVDYNTPVALFSLEMSKLQLVNRLISNVCELESEKIKSGQLSRAEWENLMSRVKNLYSAPIYVDETPSLSIFELQTKARRLVTEHGIKIIIIDYLQLMNASGMKFGSREQEVSQISRSLKQLAKELSIPIIALSQLNRSVEQRGDDRNGKRPQLSDLRESGAIEQDADIVCFIHRPEYYNRSGEDGRGNDIRGLAEFIVAKHRSGSVDTVKLRFRAKYARFENWEENINLSGESTVESRMNSGMVEAPTGVNSESIVGLGAPASSEMYIGADNGTAAGRNIADLSADPNDEEYPF